MKNYFRYVRNETGNGLGAINVMEVNGIFKVGISVCSSKDRFSKTEARDIACNRTLNEDALVYSFFEMVDNDWYDDLVNVLPYRDNLVDKFSRTFFSIVDDIVMDYAREHYKTLVQ